MKLKENKYYKVWNNISGNSGIMRVENGIIVYKYTNSTNSKASQRIREYNENKYTMAKFEEILKGAENTRIKTLTRKEAFLEMI